MKRAIFSLRTEYLIGVALIALAILDPALADTAPAVAPVVSYQYQDAQGESTVMSPVVSYQYYDSATNVTQLSSASVSYFYQGSSSNLALPTITSVNPNPVPTQSGAQTLTINGSNFTVGCTATLLNLGTGQSYPILSFASQTSSHLVFYQYFGTTPATWTVQVTNAQGASSGQYRFQVGTGATPTLAVTSANGTTFTPVQVGASSTSTFTLTNNSTATISGTASINGPFTILGTSTYTLQPGGQQTFTVQFAPTGAGAGQTGYLSFSGGTGATIQLTGSVVASPTVSGSITGKVVDANNNPIPGVRVGAMGNFAHTAPDGTYSLASFTVTSGSTPALSFDPGTNNYLGTTLTLNNLLGGSNFYAGITQLKSIPQASANLPQYIPVVLVRGLQFGPKPTGEDTYWSSVTSTLRGQNTNAPISFTNGGPNHFVNVWDPNAETTINDEVFPSLGPELDGTQGISSNAQYLKQYINNEVQNYYNVNGYLPACGINLVAHSMGGLIVREALAGYNYIPCTVTNPNDGTQSQFNVIVNSIIMLATPNAGSFAADAYENLQLAAASDLLKLANIEDGFFSPEAMSDLTHQSVVDLNQGHHFDLHPRMGEPNYIPIYSLAGTAGTIQSLPSFQPILNYAVNNYTTLSDRVTDGVVSQPSVSGEYYPKPTNGNYADSTTTGSPVAPTVLTSSIDLGPNVLTDYQSFGEYLDHVSMLSDIKVQNWIVQILQTINVPAVQTQAVKASVSSSGGTIVKAASTDSATIPVNLICDQSGSLASGNNTNLTVDCDAASVFTLTLLTSSGGVNFTLQSPSGKIINSTTSQTDSSVTYVQSTDPASGLTSTVYTITSPEQGNWMVVLDGTGLIASSVSYELSASGDSSVVMEPTTAPHFHNGREAVIGCWLLDFSKTPYKPVSASSVTAQILYPDGTVNTQTLLDDGFHGDGAANDGNYAAILPNLSEPGQYYVTYQVTGTYATNLPFTRYGTNSFTVSTEDAAIAGNLSYQPADLNINGTAQSMCVKCQVNALVPGTYLLSGLLTDSTGTLQIPASVTMENLPEGTSTATLYFDLSTFQQTGFTGTASLTNLQLSEQTSSGVKWLDAYPNSLPIQIGPLITSQPQMESVATGGSTQMSVGASGDGTLSYQWLYNGSPITGQTTSTLSLSNVTPSQEGYYSVVVTGETGTVTTPSASLSVQGSFGQWVTAYGVSTDPTSTPQKDGVSNLLKYLYNINPTRPMTASDRAVLPVMGIDATTNPGTSYLTLTYRQYASETGITIDVETSSDLKTWSTVSPPDISRKIGTDATTGDPIMEVGVKTNGATKQFIRLSVTQ